MIFNYDSLKKDWGLGGMGKLPGILKGILTGQKTEISKAVSNEISDVMRNAFDMLDPNELFMKQLSGSALTDFVKDIGDSNFEKFIAQMDEATIKGMSAKEVFDSFANSTHNVTESVSMGSKVFSGLLHGVAALGALLLTVVAVIGAITLAMKGFEAIYNNLPSVKRKHDIESGKAAQSAILQINEEFENNEKSTEELGKRYNELRSGVTYQSGEGYTNTSLSTEEFEEFLNINNELVALYPQLRAGTDALGNSYVDLGTDADKATQSLKELLAVQRDLANKEIGEKFSDQLAGVLALNANASDKIAESDAVIAATLANIEARNKGVNLFIKKISNGEDNKGNVNEYAFTINQGEDYKGKVLEAFEKAFYMNGIDIGPGYSSGSILDEFGMPTATTITYTFTADITDLNEAVEEANKLLASTDGGEYDKSKDAENQRELSLREIRDNWETLKPTLLAQFSSTATYKDFSDTIQNGISSAIANIDMGAAYKAFESQTEFDRFDDYLRNRLMYSLSNAVDRQNGEEAQKAMLKNIEELFTFDTSNLTDTEMTQLVNTMLDRIFLGDEELEHIFKVALKYEVVDEDTGDIEDMGTVNSKRRRRIYNIIGGKESGISLTELKKLKQEQLNAIIQASDNGAFNYKGSSLLELLDWIDEYKNKTNEIEKDGTLSSIFSDESYQSAAEGYEKKLSSLTGALETIRTEGTLSSEATRDLYEEFSNLAVEAEKNGGVLTEALISDAAKDELDAWIKDIRSRMGELTPEELAGANRYIESLIASWGDLGFTIDEVKEKYVDAFIDKNGDFIGRSEIVGRQFDEQISTLQELLAAEGQELDLDVVYMMIAQDQFSGTAEEIKQKYDNTQITYLIHVNEAEVEKAFQRSIERTNSEIAAWLAQNEKIVAENGQYALSPIDYESVVLGKQGNARTQRSRAEMYRTDYEKILGMEGVTNDELKLGYKNWMDAETDANNAEAEAFNSYKEQQESILNEANKKIMDALTEAALAQSEIDDALAHGIHADQSVYDRLAKAQLDEALGQRDLANGYRELANNPQLVGFRSDYLKSAADAESAATESDKSARETGYQTELNSITDLQNAYTELQSSATNTENELNNADIKRQKTTEKLYDTLINNGRDQIDNLKLQKIHYENLKRAAELALDPESAREYQSEIDNIDSSISSMESNVLGWQDTMTSLISTNASELLSVLSSAMSEMNSETGLTIDTMNELLRQFSDLAGHDVSSIFYESADGMKMNVGAAEELVDAEYELLTNELYDTIAQQKSIMEQYGDSTTDAAQKAVSAAEQRIGAAERELSMLLALYELQKQQFSDFLQWQNAESTANAGDRYNTIQSALQGMQEAYDKGLTGTDEFKAFTAMINEWGVDTVAAYEGSIETIKKYFTEDASGMGEFFKTAVEKGYGTFSDEEGYVLNIPDIVEFGHDMNLSQEMVDILLGRAEDYGVYNDWVGTRLEGEEKVKEKMEELADAQLKLNQLTRDGASDEAISAQQAVVDELKQRKENLEANTEIVAGREGRITASDLRAGVADFESLLGMRNNGEIDQETFKRKAQLLADETHIKLTPDLEMIDKSAMEKAFPGYNEIKVNPKVEPDWSLLDDSNVARDIADYTDYIEEETLRAAKLGVDMNQTVFGNIDTNNRLILEWTEENLKNYENVLGEWGRTPEQMGDFSTIFEAWDMFDGIPIAFSPMLLGENGLPELLTPDTMNNYINSLISKAGEGWTSEDLFKLDALGLDIEGRHILNMLADIGDTAQRTAEVMHFVGDTGSIASALRELDNLLAQYGVSTAEPRDESFYSAGEKAKESWKSNEESLNGYIQQLNELGLSYDELNSINLDDHQYDSAETNMIQAEQILDLIKTTLGLNVEEATLLVSLLLQIGLLLPELEETQSYSYDTTLLDNASNAVGSDHADTTVHGQMIAEQQGQYAHATQEIVLIVTTEYEDGALTPEEIQAMSLETFNTTFEVDVEGEEQLQEIKDSVAQLSTTDGFDMVVKLDQSTIESLTTTDKTVNVDTSEAQESVENISKAIEDIPDGNPTVNVGGNYEEAKDTIRALGSNIDMLHDASPQVNVAGNFDSARDSIGALFSNIEMLHDKTITVTTNNVTNNGKYTGTMFSPAHASGTAYNTINLRPISGAYADGKVGLDQNEEALVNELGTESIIRDGLWYLIPGGMHVEALKKGDVVLNHLQTADLIEHGKAFGRGKAFAQGSGVQLADLKPFAPAHATIEKGGSAATTTKGFTSYSTKAIEKSAGAYAEATEKATDATKAATDAKEKEAEATENTTTALEKFQNWASSFMDWIEVRIKRLTRTMELAISRAENIGGAGGYAPSSYKGETGYAAKNKYIDDAMATNISLRQTNESAISKKGGYTTHLKTVVKKAKSSGLVTSKEAKRLNKLIKEGGLTVEDFSKYLKTKKTSRGKDSSKTENRATAYINEYQTW